MIDYLEGAIAQADGRLLRALAEREQTIDRLQRRLEHLERDLRSVADDLSSLRGDTDPSNALAPLKALLVDLRHTDCQEGCCLHDRE